MEKAYQLAEKIVADIEKYSEEHISDAGKTITSESELKDLNTIIEEGFSLYKYLIEKDLLKDKPGLVCAANELNKIIEKLRINEKNAKKLHLSNVMQIWNQAKIAIAVLVCALLDYRDNNKG